MTNRVRFFNGRIALEDRIAAHGAVSIADGCIQALGAEAAPGERQVDLAGRLLTPGFVDVHSDAIEKEVEPRPRAVLPPFTALHALDWRCAASGVTTAYHAIAFAAGELGVRDPSRAEALVRAVKEFAARPTLVEHRVHVRYEITDPTTAPVIGQLLEDGLVDLLSFMDHTPGQGQFKAAGAYQAYLMAQHRLEAEEAAAIIARKSDGASGAHARVHELAAAARRHGVPIASHDDEGADRIALMRQLGAAISEFPLDLETAQTARAAGLSVVVGAPNVLRGGSLSGALTASDAIKSGSADALCSDYAPQTLLPAVTQLAHGDDGDLASALHSVTRGPAEALSLTDRGEIAPGRRADLLILSGADHAMRIDSVWRCGARVLDARRTAQCGDVTAEMLSQTMAP